MKTILLLHGAIGSKGQLISLEKSLQPFFQVHTLNFPGHGGEPLPNSYSMPIFAESVKKYIDQHKLYEPIIFGYSMGGYVALYGAKRHSFRAEKIITLATKFEWNETIAAKESKMLNPEVIEEKLPRFALTLQERHAPENWKEVLHKTSGLLSQLGSMAYLQDVSDLQTPTLIILGDRDKMVSLEETVAIYKKLPVASLTVLPNTAHPIEEVDTDMLAFHIKRFALV